MLTSNVLIVISPKRKEILTILYRKEPPLYWLCIEFDQRIMNSNMKMRIQFLCIYIWCNGSLFRAWFYSDQSTLVIEYRFGFLTIKIKRVKLSLTSKLLVANLAFNTVIPLKCPKAKSNCIPPCLKWALANNIPWE